jgi:phage terminase large subunit
MSFKFTTKQEEASKLINSKASNILLYGGSRSAKTFLLVYQIMMRCLIAPRSTHAIFRWRLTDLIRSVALGTLEEVIALCFPQIATKIKFDKQRNLLKIFNGSKVWFAGLEDNRGSQKVLGLGLSTIFFNEASEIPYHAYTIARTRLSEKNALVPKFFIDENPPANKNHWTYKLFFDGVTPVDENKVTDPARYAKIQMNPIDNIENIPKDYISELEQLPERERKRFLHGEFGDGIEGGVYTDVISDAMESGRMLNTLNPVKGYPIHAVFDIGYNDATAFWIVQFLPGAIYFLDFFSKERTDFFFFISEIFARGWRLQNIYLPHDARNTHQATGVNLETLAVQAGADPLTDPEFRYNVIVLDKALKVFDGINTARIMFKTCKFDLSKCSEGINALKNYRFAHNHKLGVYSNSPIEDWTSHAADAFRYVFMAFYRQPPVKMKMKRVPGTFYVSDLIGNVFNNKKERIDY